MTTMQITRAVEYGAMGLICLARRGPGATVMLEDISQEEAIPSSFLGKIFQNLAKAGLTRSIRGSRGGFMLAREPKSISLLDVFEAIEGKIALQRCLEPTPSCERQEGCALCSVFEQAQDQVKDVFSQTTIADLVKKHHPLRHDPRGNPLSAASPSATPRKTRR